VRARDLSPHEGASCTGYLASAGVPVLFCPYRHQTGCQRAGVSLRRSEHARSARRVSEVVSAESGLAKWMLLYEYEYLSVFVSFIPMELIELRLTPNAGRYEKYRNHLYSYEYRYRVSDEVEGWVYGISISCSPKTTTLRCHRNEH
jgi:hypothetical protein